MSIPAGYEPRWNPTDGAYLDGPVGEVPPDWRHPAPLDRYDSPAALMRQAKAEEAAEDDEVRIIAVARMAGWDDHTKRQFWVCWCADRTHSKGFLERQTCTDAESAAVLAEVRGGHPITRTTITVTSPVVEVAS